MSYIMYQNALERCIPKMKNLKRLLSLEAKISPCSEHLEIKTDNYEDKFPLVWLRDNCQCSKCYNVSDNSRTVNWDKFDLNIRAHNVEPKDDSSVNVQWTDEHRSTYDLEWLRKRSFKKEVQDKYLKNVCKTPKIHWSKTEFSNIFKRYDFEKILGSDLYLYNFLQHLTRYGTTLVENVPLDSQELKCRVLTDRIGFGRRVIPGSSNEFYWRWNCSQELDATYVPFSTNPNQLHSNFVFYDNPIGVTILHCLMLTGGKGGEFLFIDGFQIAETIRKNNPEIFNVLSTLKVNWSHYDTETGNQKLTQSPCICLDDEGNVVKINFSVLERDSYLTMNIKDVKLWYQANKHFHDLCNDNAAKYKLKPGEMFVFDNDRIVHGRLQYEDVENMELLMAFNFIDWDEIHGKLRGLKEKLNM